MTYAVTWDSELGLILCCCLVPYKKEGQVHCRTPTLSISMSILQFIVQTKTFLKVKRDAVNNYSGKQISTNTMPASPAGKIGHMTYEPQTTKDGLRKPLTLGTECQNVG